MVKSMAFAKRLAALREKAGWTKYALAKRSGVTKQAIAKLETGENEPSWETVQKLALALDVDCQEFVDPDITIPSAEESAPGKPGRPRRQPIEILPISKRSRGRPRKGS
jgi:transcriptional regulator with XRE-family HTH domain